tara:strand:+ start:984 stop:1661 length:678 start_codon:yes stop_codon:yes gene_type:complete
MVSKTKQANSLPDISVVVCIFNHEKWIERCLRSLFNQININKKSFEIILVEDASSDSSLKIIKAYSDFANVKIVRNTKNIGLPKSINKGIKNSKGRYIVRVDSDDYVGRNFLYLSKLFLDMNREYQAVAVDYYMVDNDERILKKVNSQKKEIACGVMFRKECLIDIGLYNQKFKMREGHELRKRFERKFSIGHLEFPLYKYRSHEKNRTKNKIKTKKFNKLLKNI